MVNQKELFDALCDMGVDFFTGVPDSLLNDFCLYMTNNLSARQHVMAANEGNAIGIAAGHYMATGKLPLVYMQNSGIGNATNPFIMLLTAVTAVYVNRPTKCLASRIQYVVH